MKEVPMLEVIRQTNGFTVVNHSSGTITNAVLYSTHRIVKPDQPHTLSWIAFTLIALVVLYYTHRFVYRSGFRAGKYQEQVDRFNNGA